MIESLQHIANVASMEHRLPRDVNDSATLWEGDEQTVRFLLEEGKLNLCVRLMREYSQTMAQLKPPSRQCAPRLAIFFFSKRS